MAVNKLKFKSVNDLKADVDSRWNKISKNTRKELIIKKYTELGLLCRAKELIEIKRYEDAYENLYLMLNMASYILDNEKDKTYAQSLVGKDFQKAVNLIEELISILNPIYNKENYVNGEKTKICSNEELLHEGNTVSCQETEEEGPYITSAKLYTALKAGAEQILILDVRLDSEFATSHIDSKFMNVPINCINIPPEVNRKGMSAHQISCQLPESARGLWSQRASFQKLVLIGNSEQDERPEILRNVLLNYDSVEHSSGAVYILKEGYEGWVEAYFPENRTKFVQKDDGLNTVNYELSFEVHEETKQHIEEGKKPRPTFDRSKKPAALKMNSEITNEILNKRIEEMRDALAFENDRSDTITEQKEKLRRQCEEKVNEEYINTIRELSLEELERCKKESELKSAKIKELEDSMRDLLRTKEQAELEASLKEQELKVVKKRLENDEKTINLMSEIPAKTLVSSSTNFPTELPQAPYINRATKPKLPEQRIIPKEQPVIYKSPGLTGLKNLGNTCYMNSILQCISNNADLAEYFVSRAYNYDINENHRTRGEVAKRVAQVVQKLWQGNTKSFAAVNFKDAMGALKAEYRTSEQQDSHEFLTFLMDWLHNDLNKGDVTSKNDLKQHSEMDKVWQKFKEKNQSLISKLFYGLQKSTVRCLKCGEESVTYEPFSNLSLSIPEGENIPLQRCIQDYLKGESISGWRCPRCKVEQPAERTTVLCKLPVMLVIHLKRFSFLDIHSSKRTTLVTFPLENLDLPSISKGQGQNKTYYNLYGVSNHYGTMQAGHYTAYCKHHEFNRWYRFDDHEVSEIPPSRVETNAAYILFYSSNQPVNASS